MLDKGGVFLFVFSVVFALSFFVLTVEATITLQINDVRKIYPPEKPLNGSVLITFDSVLPENPKLAPSIDGYGYPQISITPYLSNIAYQYKEYQFGYNITASGKNEWYESPEITFHYKISASGTCGNQACAEAGNCDCGGLCSPPSSPPYYCNWAITRQDSIQASVSASDGLKYIANGLDLISPPTNENPEDTKWSELLNNPTSPYGVYTVMRAACGNSDYMGQITEPNGWIKRSLPNEQFQPVPGTTNRKITIEPFDEKSLTTERERFVDGGCSQPYVCGGIYKDGVLMTSGFLVNGTSGEVTIYNYNPNSVYTITYFPPNGPFLCAYSATRKPNSTNWVRNIPQQGIVSYDKPFSKSYTTVQLPNVFNATNKAFVNPPPCPSYVSDCTQTASYSAVKTSDPSNSVSLSYDSNTRTVHATTSSKELTGTKKITIPLSALNIETPETVETHTLYISLVSDGSELASAESFFDVCEDSDGDGYCTETGDCNDTNSKVYPGAKEYCNGIDDDCDGKIDEDFYAAGERLGDSCGTGICNGIFVCKGDGTGVVCNSTQSPKREICNNDLDDDCDGLTDEFYETDSSGKVIFACDECEEGKTEMCKKSIGECKKNPGYRTCVNGKWSICRGGYEPQDETCNGKDDDCNGIVDDVNGGSSIEETSCGCYGSGYPSLEECDGIDNDCNGLVDDKEGCCTEGQTRSCGIDKGICKKGTQYCKNGFWETECRGGVMPNPDGEICYNNLDDNCNGQTDENCVTSFTCNNGRQDPNEEGIDCGGSCPERCGIPYNWLLVAGGVIILILTVAFVQLRGNF